MSPRKPRPGERPTGRVQTTASIRRGDPPPPKLPRTGAGSGCFSVLLISAGGVLAAVEAVRGVLS